jgi:outer membrane lipopolysaccharide assembly protein LptE/RlpB
MNAAMSDHDLEQLDLIASRVRALLWAVAGLFILGTGAGGWLTRQEMRMSDLSQKVALQSAIQNDLSREMQSDRLAAARLEVKMAHAIQLLEELKRDLRER